MDAGEIERFCNELAPRLETAGTLEAELDRELARKFNAFDYLRTDEMGLSKVIADLLNPKGKHGQGDIFLRLLLGKLEFNERGDLENSDAYTELKIENGRRIDILIEMGNACLAIENKPYAGDQQNQIEDYLCWLRKKYKGGFRLIYLPPTGAPPSEESVALDHVAEYTETFRIMPYHNVEGSDWEDSFEGFRTNFGLTDWLKECRMHCNVERLRWFLREAETFCERKFGDDPMTMGKTETVKRFVLESERNWDTAWAVRSTVPQVEQAVHGKFLEAIAKRLGEKGYGYWWSCYKEKRYSSWVRAHLPHWPEFESPAESDWTHIHLALEASDQNADTWYIGIRMPERKAKMSENDRHLRERIEQRLKGDAYPSQEWCPYWKWLDEEYRFWGPLTFRINTEIQEKDWKLVNYMVDQFDQLAKFAEPILNKIEGT